MLETIAEPGQLEEKKLNELIVAELLNDYRHHLEECLGPQAENALVAVGLGERLLRYQLVIVLETPLVSQTQVKCENSLVRQASQGAAKAVIRRA